MEVGERAGSALELGVRRTTLCVWIFHFRGPEPTFYYWAVLLWQEAWQLPLSELSC